MMLIFDVNGTRFEIIPVRLRAAREAVLGAVDDVFDEVSGSIKVVSLEPALRRGMVGQENLAPFQFLAYIPRHFDSP